MDFATAATAIGLVNSAISSLKNARELAQDTTDIELKEKISEVYDVLLQLKEVALNFDDENRKLKEQLKTSAAYVGPVPPNGYYFAASDTAQEHPLCPKCYQLEPSQKAFMGSPDDWNGEKRQCKLCHHVMDEHRISRQPQQIRPYNPY